ncbi:unnamed protein product [Strongylus vulgaris]|uniref:ATP synthase mitochondrial F1 complex assembly factor 2 n=1 Tax=Strongylus vulgaris TaxID=40348 RepID=A0A3P7JGI6_STRVU|nr:unnamed protein product [Strongylus vulgaris]
MISASAVVSPEDTRIVEKWLLSHNFWALTGMQYAVESVKSVLLPYSVMTFKLQAEDAVHRAMLEQRTQAETWGSVEWAHGVEEEELTTRLAAAALFVYFNSNAVEWAHGVEEEELTTRLAAAALFVYFNSNAVIKKKL